MRMCPGASHSKFASSTFDCTCVVLVHVHSNQWISIITARYAVSLNDLFPLKPQECTNNTVWELFTSDPDFSVAANIARRLEVLVQVSIFIRADLNSTLFLPINSAIGEDFYQFSECTYFEKL